LGGKAVGGGGLSWFGFAGGWRGLGGDIVVDGSLALGRVSLHAGLGILDKRDSWWIGIPALITLQHRQFPA